MFENTRHRIDAAPDVIVSLVDYEIEEEPEKEPEEEVVVSTCAVPPEKSTEPLNRSRYTFKLKTDAIADCESGMSEADVARKHKVHPSNINRFICLCLTYQ